MNIFTQFVPQSWLADLHATMLDRDARTDFERLPAARTSPPSHAREGTAGV